MDTGINPMGTDSEGQVWENPKAYYRAEEKAAPLAESAGAQNIGQSWMVGSTAAHRQTSETSNRTQAQCPAPDDLDPG